MARAHIRLRGLRPGDARPALGSKRQRCGAAPPSAHARPPPHSGYHWDGSPRRFFEGWYWKVTDPASGQSFAIIFSVEDPGQEGQAVGAQVMGLDDGYIAQYDKSTRNFWAARNELALGCVFEGQRGARPTAPRRMLPAQDFGRDVLQGFQSSWDFHQGSLVAREASAAGSPLSTVQSCSWQFSVKPLCGWGDEGSNQRATAGWLSVLSVFEPHWQVLMAHGLATGWLQWGERRLEFTDAPSYAEKNWGGGFPTKWCWIQCNTFENQPGLSITAVGARRGLLGLRGVEEDVGMIGIHHEGRFIELVPWNGTVDWSISPWGRWRITARSDEWEAVLEAGAAVPGQVLRAPTLTQGLAPFCRDTFFGTCKLSLWRVQPARVLVLEATSTTAALEVGGGPWWDEWSASAKMLEPLSTLVKLPVDLGAVSRFAPDFLRPPGL